MNSTLKFYNVDFNVNSNAEIEDFKDYLLSKSASSTEIRDFQYIRHANELTIKIDESAVIVDSKLSQYNYVSIQNDNDDETATVSQKIFYYFITNRLQVSPNTVQLFLTLDKLNTFCRQDGTDAEHTNIQDYYFSEKSFTIREHCARVENAHFTTPDGRELWQRKFNRVSEDSNLEYVKESEEIINEENNLNWYLVYQSQNTISETSQNIPVNMYIIADTALKVAEGSEEYFEVDPDDLPHRTNASPSNYFPCIFLGRYASERFIGARLRYIEYGTNEQKFIDINTNNSSIAYMLLFNTGTHYQITFRRYKNNTNWISEDDDLMVFEIAANSKLQIYSNIVQKLPLYWIQGNDTFNQIKRDVTPTSYDIGIYLGILANLQEPQAWLIYLEKAGGETTYTTINKFDTVDRTDTKLIKIIKLPYAPFTPIIGEVEGVGQVISALPEYLTVDTVTYGQQYKYLKVKQDYTGLLSREIPVNFNIYSDLFTEFFNELDVRNDFNESKLYTSNYMYYKFVYDSFSFLIRNEDLKLNEYPTAESLNLILDFVTSTSMNSRFLFKLKNLPQLERQDYDKILNIARNNEVQIFNSAYLNYLRNGYNYDVKNKNLQAGAALSRTVLGALGGILTGNYIGAAAGAIGGALSGATQIASAENSIEAKLEQLKNQSVSVSGSDDLDLLTYYSENRAKIVNYSVFNREWQNAANRFYFYGYLVNRAGAPVTMGRKWFNYAQADAVILPKSATVTPYLDELKRIWKEGVTIYHNGGTQQNPIYDFKQEKANNELFVEEYLHTAQS